MNKHYCMALSWWRNRGKKFSKHQGQHLNPSSSIPCSHLYHPSEYSDLPNLTPILHKGKMRLCPFIVYFNTGIKTKIWAVAEPWYYFTVITVTVLFRVGYDALPFGKSSHCTVSYIHFVLSIEQWSPESFPHSTDRTLKPWEGKLTDWDHPGLLFLGLPFPPRKIRTTWEAFLESIVQAIDTQGIGTLL